MVDQKILQNLPEDPGVYLMRDKTGTVIYVGKAKILKNRVRQYFQNTERHAPKVKAMVSRIASFEYILTDSELEALILECNLIKKYRPYYNILLKDDKNYPYIRVTVQETYPRLQFVRKMKKDDAKYYGPYSSSATAREVMDFACKLFQIPTCDILLPRDMGKRRACINAQIGRCCAPCEYFISPEEYGEKIKEACAFLGGGGTELIEQLTEKMEAAAENLEFERAASLRDKINSIRQMDRKQKIVSDKHADEDVIGFYVHANKTFAEIFFIRGGRIVGRRDSVLSNTGGMTEGEVASGFVKQFYQDADFVPQHVYIQYLCDDEALLSAWLSDMAGRNVKLHTPQRGDKKALVEMAHKNAKQAALNHMLKNAEGRNGMKRLILDLKEELGLSSPPYRIESFDISNTAGEDNVGCMVVFVNGEPAKRFYRRFKIETAVGGDDYHSMAEMLLRRIQNAREEEKKIESGELKRESAKFLPLPDCIFLDGGKGHLSVVSKLLELTDTDIPLFAMVKNDKHKTSALLKADGSRVELKPRSEEFRLVSAIQEEVHRFAISYHRNLRSMRMRHSSLEQIEGVGKITAEKLLKHFKSIKAIKTADVDALRKAGISRKTAENIYSYFQK